MFNFSMTDQNKPFRQNHLTKAIFQLIKNGRFTLKVKNSQIQRAISNPLLQMYNWHISYLNSLVNYFY